MWRTFELLDEGFRWFIKSVDSHYIIIVPIGGVSKSKLPEELKHYRKRFININILNINEWLKVVFN